MKLEKMVPKYIRNTERVLGEIQRSSTNEEKVQSVIEAAKRYLEDAKYYQMKNELETSLASVAYCEGLLDALRLLGAVEFSW